MLSLFLSFHDKAHPEARIAEADYARFVEVAKATPELERLLVYIPESASDPYLNDGPPPQLVAQLYFADIPELEAAAARGGHLQALAHRDTLPSLARAEVTQQAMLTRTFPVPDSQLRRAPGGLPCSYLVDYIGPAEDWNEWASYYITHHPLIMARFPGIRAIEIHTRIDWCGFLPWPRANHMLRNRVMFDSAAALTAANHSPVRHEMRADFAKFPRFEGGNTHFPMATLDVAL